AFGVGDIAASDCNIGERSVCGEREHTDAVIGKAGAEERMRAADHRRCDGVELAKIGQRPVQEFERSVVRDVGGIDESDGHVWFSSLYSASTNFLARRAR